MSRHRYGYAVEPENTVDAFEMVVIVKHDLVAGTANAMLRRGPPAGRVRLRGGVEVATAEDDGYLVGYVYDATRDASDLVDPRRARHHRRAGGVRRVAPAGAVRLPRELGRGLVSRRHRTRTPSRPRP